MLHGSQAQSTRLRQMNAKHLGGAGPGRAKINETSDKPEIVRMAGKCGAMRQCKEWMYGGDRASSN